MIFKQQICQYLARNRKNPLATKFNKYLMRFHQGYENLNYDFDSNGEAFVLQTLQARAGIKTILDVGANQGDWSQIAARTFPQAAIHSFEIVSSTYQKLAENCRSCPNVTTHNVGMSDQNGTTTVYFSQAQSVLATCVPGFTQSFHNYEPKTEVAKVTTGDSFCAENQLTSVDFLKMDVEGFEPNVLRGFAGMLKSGRIKIIQFEYGYINAATKFLLKDFYDVLTPFGMKIGKIYPNYVDFRDYNFRDENFYGPNYLAVHESLIPVIQALS